MPPVLGPGRRRSRRLWSWLVASGSTFLPSHSTMKLASSPCRNSSITTRAPPALCATPSLLSQQHEVDRLVRLVERHRHDHALAGGQAVGLDDDRRARAVDVGVGRGGVGEGWRTRAVGMPWRCMKALAKALELSSCAAAWVGPKMRRPRARNTSTTPAASGASGPTTVSAIFSAAAKSASAAGSVIGTFSSARVERGAAVARRHVDRLHLAATAPASRPARARGRRRR